MSARPTSRLSESSGSAPLSGRRSSSALGSFDSKAPSVPPTTHGQKSRAVALNESYSGATTNSSPAGAGAACKTFGVSTAVAMMRRAGNAKVVIRDYTIDDLRRQRRTERLAALAQQLAERREQAARALAAAPVGPAATAAQLNAIAEEGAAALGSGLSGRPRRTPAVATGASSSGRSGGPEALVSMNASKSYTRSRVWSLSGSAHFDSSSSVDLRNGRGRSTDPRALNGAASGSVGSVLRSSESAAASVDALWSDDDSASTVDEAVARAFASDSGDGRKAANTRDRHQRGRQSRRTERALQTLSQARSASAASTGGLAELLASLSRSSTQDSVLARTGSFVRGDTSATATAPLVPLGGAAPRRAPGRPRRPRYYYLSRLVPFLVPRTLPLKSSQIGLDSVDWRAPSFKSKQRLRDLHEKFLSGALSVVQRDSGELSFAPGVALPFIKELLTCQLPTVARAPRARALDTSQIAQLRSSNFAMYLRYMRGLRYSSVMERRKRELERARMTFLSKLGELLLVKSRVEALQRRAADNQQAYVATRQTKMEYLSQLMERLEEQNGDVLDDYKQRRRETMIAEEEYLELCHRCANVENAAEARRRLLEVRHESLGREVTSLHAFKAEHDKQSILTQQSKNALAQQKAALLESQRQQIERLYERHELERSSLQAQFSVRIEQLLKRNMDDSSNIVDNVLSKLNNLGRQLRAKIADTASHNRQSAEKIAQLQEAIRANGAKRTGAADPRRAVLEMPRPNVAAM